MAFTLNKHDTDLLSSLAQCRILTVSQAAVLMGRSLRSARRRIDDLTNGDLLAIHHPAGHKGRGRPEGVITLTQQGLQLLKQMRAVDFAAAGSMVVGFNGHQLDHDILVSWVRVHLCHIARQIARLSVRFEIPALPVLETKESCKSKKGRPHEPVQGLIPDGVLSITDMERDKALLFFFEVDMRTESQTSGKHGAPSIVQKIQAYQTMFRGGAYKRYEQAWGRSLNGFRVLFLTSTPVRCLTLCRLVHP